MADERTREIDRPTDPKSCLKKIKKDTSEPVEWAEMKLKTEDATLGTDVSTPKGSIYESLEKRFMNSYKVLLIKQWQKSSEAQAKARA